MHRLAKKSFYLKSTKGEEYQLGVWREGREVRSLDVGEVRLSSNQLQQKKIGIDLEQLIKANLPEVSEKSVILLQ